MANAITPGNSDNSIQSRASNEEPQQDETKVNTEPDELISDGSASAFEGTESIDSHEQDLELKRKREMLKNDPSGRSNY